MESTPIAISSDATAVTGPGANRIQFMGCAIDSMTRQETLEHVLQWCRQDEISPKTLITLNAALLMMMKSDPALARACNAGDIIVADGMPIVWSTKLLGTPLADRVAGVDLMQKLLEEGGKQGISVYFLGARQAVIDTLLDLCRERYPGLRIAGSRNG